MSRCRGACQECCPPGRRPPEEITVEHPDDLYNLEGESFFPPTNVCWCGAAISAADTEELEIHSYCYPGMAK